MRSLWHQAVVERMHREVDERICQAALAVAIVVLARALGQWLQRRAQRGATDLVEEALDEHDAFVGGGEGAASCLHALFLIVDETLRVTRMPCMHAPVAEGKDVELARLAQQLGLVEAFAQGRRSPS